MEDFQIGDIVKQKNPSMVWQKELRYTITKVNKTTVWCYENKTPRNIYKNQPKRILIKA